MRWSPPREQVRRLAAVAAIGGLAFAAQGPLSTAASFTGSAAVQTTQFATSAWCVTNQYPAAVAATGTVRNYLRLDQAANPPATVTDSATGAPDGGQDGTGATWGQPGLLDCVPNTAVQLNGATGQARIWANPPVAAPGQNTFTISAWVDVTSGQGRLIGFGRMTAGGTPTNANGDDRMLFVDSAGQLRFGVSPVAGTRVTVQSAASIVGARHHVVASLGPAGMKLYVDGVLQAQNTTVTTGRNYRGAWRIGFDNLQAAWGVTAPNTMPVATVDEVAIWHAQLTDTQVAMLAGANHY